MSCPVCKNLTGCSVCNSLNEDFSEEIRSNDKPKCKLIGEDGNVFAIIGTVSKALKKAGKKELAKEFQEKAFAADSYDAVLNLTHEYVEVE